jgi:hypothetical protein
MTLDTKHEANVASTKQDVSLNAAERRVVSAFVNSPGKILGIMRERGINSHLVVAGSQVWYIGDGLPDQRSFYITQYESSRTIVQCLGHTNGLSRLLSRGILKQDRGYPSGNVWMLAHDIEHQLESEARRQQQALFG